MAEVAKKRNAVTKEEFLDVLEPHLNAELESVLGTNSNGDKKKLSRGKVWDTFKLCMDVVFDLTSKDDIDGVSLAGVLRTRKLVSKRSNNVILKIDVPSSVSEQLAKGKGFLNPEGDAE